MSLEVVSLVGRPSWLRLIQGYRICPRMERAKSLDHPERLRLRWTEMSGLARLRTLRASLRRVPRFSGAWSLRFRALVRGRDDPVVERLCLTNRLRAALPCFAGNSRRAWGDQTT